MTTNNSPLPWPTLMPDPTEAVRRALADSAPEALRMIEPWLDAWRMPLAWWAQAAQSATPWWWAAWPGSELASASGRGAASSAASTAATTSMASSAAAARAATTAALKGAVSSSTPWATAVSPAEWAAEATPSAPKTRKTRKANEVAAPAKVVTVVALAKAAAAPAATKKPAPRRAAAPAAPVATVAPKRPDNLTLVEGIDPQIAKKLGEAGIQHFATLAKTQTRQLQTILDNAGSRFKLARPETWAEQALLLARGDTAAFEKLAAQLRGGVRA